MALYLTQMMPVQNDCRRCLRRAGFLFSARSNEEVDSFANRLQIPRLFNDTSGGISVWLINEHWHKLLSLDDTIVLLNLENFRESFRKIMDELKGQNSNAEE